jgi:prepilin-type N-terminal cleavage/methylation domain-containing protein
MKFKTNINKGFTLIELLVVIAIIGLLSSIMTSSFSAVRSKARDTKRVAEMRSIEKAINLYALSTNGSVPLSIYSDFASIPKKLSDGSIDCNKPELVNFMNEFYDTLIQAKALSSRPTSDAQASKGYCYVYMSDISIVAGASYDQYGNYISSGPLAVISNKVRNAVFGSFLENTKTVTGFQAFAGISYGNSLPMNPNVNLTTGLNVGTNYNNVQSGGGPEFGSCDVNDPSGSCYSGGSGSDYCDVNDPYGSCYSGGSGSCDVNDPYGSCYSYCDVNDPYGSCYSGGSGSDYCDVNDPYGSCYSGGSGSDYCDINDPYGSCYSGS